MNNINKIADIYNTAQDKPETNIHQKDPSSGKDFANVWEALDFKNWNHKNKDYDFNYLSSIIRKFVSKENEYATKLNPKLLNLYKTTVADKLSNMFLPGGPFTAFNGRILLEKEFENISNVLKSAYEEVASISGKSVEDTGDSWTVAKWQNLLKSLLNRAKSQLQSIKTKADASSDSKKKIYQSAISAKQTYVNLLSNLLKQLYNLVEKNNLGLKDKVSDSLLSGYSSESRRDRQFPGESGGRSRGGARTYTDSEGQSREVTQDSLLDFPLFIQNDELWIKELIEAYGLGDKYSLLVSSKAPEVLSFKLWTSSYWKRVNEDLQKTGLTQYQYAQYVHDLRNALLEMQEQYNEHMKSKGNRPNSKQLENFGKLIGSLQAVSERFPYTPQTEAKQEAKASTYQSWLNKQFTDGFDGFINKLKDLGYTATGASNSIYKNDNKKRAVDTRDGKLYEFANGEWKPTSNVIEHTVADL